MSAKKEKRPEWLAYPYDNSERSHALFAYDRTERTPLSLSEVNYAKAGMLLETYVDALHLALVMNEPALVRKLRDRPEEIRDPAFFKNNRYQPPRFVREAIGDYRAATSFFRGDMAMRGQGPWLQDKQPDAVGFAQALHGQLRKVATDYGKQFTIEFFPPPGAGGTIPAKLWSHFKAAEEMLSQFRTLQKEYGELQRKVAADYRKKQAMITEETEKESARITKAKERKNSFSAFLGSDAFVHLRQEIKEAMDDLIHALSPAHGGSGHGLMDKFYLKYGDHHLPIQNTQRIDSRFSLSYPALLMVSLGSKGRHDIDEVTASHEIFVLFSQVIGVESQITENLQALHDQVIMKALRAKGVRPNDDLLYGSVRQSELAESVKDHGCGIQLLYTFHQAAGQVQKIYPEGKNLALDDMEALLGLAGIDTPWLEALDTPQEAACMLYAIERRVSLAPRVSREQVIAMERLAGVANEMGKYRSFAKVPVRLKTFLADFVKNMREGDNDLYPSMAEVEHAIELLALSLDKMTGEETKHIPEKGQERGRG